MTPSIDTAGLSVCGANIGFDIPEGFRRQVRDALAYTTVASSDGPPTMWYRYVSGVGEPHFVRDDPVRSPTAAFVGRSIEQLIDDLHLSVALHATEHVFVHAGVVAWNGLVIVIPGRSRTGKSTLVQALVRAGATYLSDEYALVMTDGTIAPYARPIQLRTAAGRSRLDAKKIGPVADRALPAGLVVFTRYNRDAEFWPMPVPPAEAALELFDNTVVAAVWPDRAVTAVAQVARAAAAIRSDRPEADSTAQQILDLADRLGIER